MKGKRHESLLPISLGPAALEPVAWGLILCCFVLVGCQRTEPSPLVEYELQIDRGGSVESVPVVAPERSTVLEAMLAAREQGEFDFEYQGQGAMAFIVEIDGVRNDVDQQRFWIYYVNDDLAGVGVGSNRLSAGDTIRWTYRQSPY